MILQSTTIPAVLSTAVVAATRASPREHLNGPIVPQSIDAADDPHAETKHASDERIPAIFQEKLPLTPGHDGQQQQPTQALRNGGKDPSHDSRSITAFDASAELGIFDESEQLPGQSLPIRRGLDEDCLDGRPVIGADSNFQNLVSACLYSEAFCPYDANLSCWNTSEVTSMSLAFKDAKAFNQPIDSWDTSRVTDMQGMFQNAFAFNQPIGVWETSAVTDMSGMFAAASLFNQPLDSWDFSSVTSMRIMFQGALTFNHPVETWNTSSAVNMYSMFSFAQSFNQPIDSWDVSTCRHMHFMFFNAAAFNQCLSTWADKTIDTVTVSYMLHESGCPYITDPDPSLGPWCQGTIQSCSLSESSSPVSDWASSIAFGVVIPSIAALIL